MEQSYTLFPFMPLITTHVVGMNCTCSIGVENRGSRNGFLEGCDTEGCKLYNKHVNILVHVHVCTCQFGWQSHSFGNYMIVSSQSSQYVETLSPSVYMYILICYTSSFTIMLTYCTCSSIAIYMYMYFLCLANLSCINLVSNCNMCRRNYPLASCMEQLLSSKYIELNGVQQLAFASECWETHF